MKNFLMILFLLLPIAITSCGDDGDDGDNNGNAVSGLNGTFVYVDEDGEKASFKFNDPNVVYTYLGDTYRGTFIIKDNLIIMTMKYVEPDGKNSANNENWTYKFILKGKELTLTPFSTDAEGWNGDNPVTFHRV